MVYNDIEFGKYLKSIREREHVSMTEVCEGICNTSTLSRIENGKKETGKLVQDRLLGRLGVASENFENMIFSDEYERWMLMQRIVMLVQHGEMDEADSLLDKIMAEWDIAKRYSTEEDLDAVLQMQFCLCMKAQIRRCSGAQEEELRSLYHDALKCTVTVLDETDKDITSFQGKYFSVEEVCLIIEYCNYMPVEQGRQYICRVMDYIRKRFSDRVVLAKIYPKALYGWYQIEKKHGNISRAGKNAFLCHATEAIECLRNARRSFYLCELLDMKMELIKDLAGEEANSWGTAGDDYCAVELIDIDFEDKYGNTDRYNMEAQYTWCRIIREVVENIYNRTGMKAYMQEICYIYADTEVYCIEEIIGTRRRMLGMGYKELCEGICSDRTIFRIEGKSTRPQRNIIHSLFVRLGLSGELSRIEIISPDIEVYEMFNRLRNYLNRRDFCKAEGMLGEITARVDTSIPQNRQVLNRIRTCLMYRSGKLGVDEYIDTIKNILEYTVPYSAAVGDGAKYLTNEEASCLTNILATKYKDRPEVEECFSALLHMYEDKEDRINNFIGMYEFVMTPLASYMGDCGRYDEADEKSAFIIENALYNRRLGTSANSLYDMLWNDRQRKNSGIPMHRDIEYRDELKRCLVMSSFVRRVHGYEFYKDKLSKS